jgi:glycine/D-amino acid oxidase-like deaminating enzyme
LACDVVIVGGGLTGAAVAAEFAAAGVDVILLESALVARGSTSGSSALLLQEPDRGLPELTRLFGRSAASRIWALSRDAVRDLVATLRRLRVACDLVEQDTCYYTTDADAVRALRHELEARRAAGFGGEWLTPGALRRLTGLPGRGAILTGGGAQCDPYKACMGLLAAAERAGARLFERSRVRHVAATARGVRVRTAQSTIDASQVVVATGYATRDFRPLAGRFQMKQTYVLATRPLSSRERSELGLGDVMLWDTGRPYHYARWTPDRRLLLGGGDRPARGGHRRAARLRTAVRELRGDFEALLPALADIEIEHAWEGLFALTPDSLPYIGPHRRYPHHLFALGYGGNGMTFGFLAARLLLEQWRGVRSPDHALFRFGRRRSTLPRP